MRDTFNLNAATAGPSSGYKAQLDVLCEGLGIPLPVTALKIYDRRIGEGQDIKDEVAIHLAAGTIEAVPRIILYNATHTSRFQKPYILYEAVGADDWRIHNTKYNSRSRSPLAEELAALISTIDSKVLSCPGMLTVHPSMPNQGRSSVLGASIRKNIRPYFGHQSLVKPSLIAFISAMLNQQAHAPM